MSEKVLPVGSIKKCRPKTSKKLFEENTKNHDVVAPQCSRKQERKKRKKLEKALTNTGVCAQDSAKNVLKLETLFDVRTEEIIRLTIQFKKTAKEAAPENDIEGTSKQIAKQVEQLKNPKKENKSKIKVDQDTEYQKTKVKNINTMHENNDIWGQLTRQLEQLKVPQNEKKRKKKEVQENTQKDSKAETLFFKSKEDTRDVSKVKVPVDKSGEQVQERHEFNETTGAAPENNSGDISEQLAEQVKQQKSPKKGRKSKQKVIQDTVCQKTETNVNSIKENNDVWDQLARQLEQLKVPQNEKKCKKKEVRENTQKDSKVETLFLKSKEDTKDVSKVKVPVDKSKEQVQERHEFNETTGVAPKNDSEDISEQLTEQVKQQKSPKKGRKSKQKVVQDTVYQKTGTNVDTVKENNDVWDQLARQLNELKALQITKKSKKKKIQKSAEAELKPEIQCGSSKECTSITNKFNTTKEISYESEPIDLSELLMKQMVLQGNPKKQKKSKKKCVQETKCEKQKVTREDACARTRNANTKVENNGSSMHRNLENKSNIGPRFCTSKKQLRLTDRFSKPTEITCESDSEDIAKQLIEEMGQQEVRKKKRKRKKVKTIDREYQEAEAIVEDEQDNASTSKKNLNAEEKCKKKLAQAFPEYMSREEVEKILKEQASSNEEYIQGCLRINPKCYKHAYLSLGEKSDILIVGLCDRNRALEGDTVVVHINPPEKWQTHSDGKKRRTGVVVCILKEVHSRTAIGYMKKIGCHVQFQPRDQRVPLLRIHPNSLPMKFLRHPKLYEETLFMAKITQWEKPNFAIGDMIEIIGNTGDLEAQSRAILLEHDLDVTPYSEDLLKELPSIDYALTENDLKDREDWRHECVFTIDPATAVDLDDAVSYKVLDNGNYEIGVHIADVTHFLEFLSPLDIEVAKRATTVYLTDKVYHMLPKQLCQVCSLLPGEEKLCFSVIWEMTQKAEIVKHRFAKTVLKSCCQMAYQHAQMFIENPNFNWPDDFINIKGSFSISDLSKIVNSLHRLATLLRDKRYANGALRMDLPKLHVAIDKITGLPTSYSIEEHTDSNRLIEEFMLLANMTVATHLYNTIPEIALLRNHRHPSKRLLSQARDSLQIFGIHLDIETAGALHDSIKRYEMEAESESDEIKTIMKYRMMVINNLCSKSMARATYTCSSNVEAKTELRHYALNVPLYTHFTSPIRRYPDCVVHRLLYSTMQNIFQPENWTTKLCAQIAENCNVKKYSAKLAQERSSELYFAQLIKLNGPRITVGIVVDVREHCMDVILCKIGLKLRIHLMQLENIAMAKYSTEQSVPTITISWNNPPITQVINVFTLLHVRIETNPNLYRLIGLPVPPQTETDLH